MTDCLDLDVGGYIVHEGQTASEDHDNVTGYTVLNFAQRGCVANDVRMWGKAYAEVSARAQFTRNTPSTKIVHTTDAMEYDFNKSADYLSHLKQRKIFVH